jgi:hypothetical protein
LFAQQTGHPGLAGTGLAGDQHGSSAHSQADLFSVMLTTEEQATTTHLGGRQSRLLRDPTDIVRDRCRPRSVHDFVRNGAQGRTAPRNRDTDFTGIQEIVIVLGVADPNGVVNRNAQLEQGLPEPGRLCNCLRQYHQPAAVERKNERLLEPSEYFKRRARGAGVGFDNRFADRHVHVSAPQLVDEGCVRGMAQDNMAAARWEFQDGTVFGDDDIEAREVAADPPQVRETPAGDQNHDEALLPCSGDRIADSRIENSINRDGPVVVKRESRKFHCRYGPVALACTSVADGSPQLSGHPCRKSGSASRQRGTWE